MGNELSGLMGLVALALPVAALVTVMIVAIRQIRHRRRGGSPTELTGRYGTPVPRADTAKPAKAVAAEPAPPAPPDLSATEIARRISEAEARGAEGELPVLYLALARDRVVENRSDEAADLLRKSIRLAARLGHKETHARARLDLGDLAREQGDLTTACEHWQIARQLFYETKSTAPLAQAEGRMRQNGCPTDWVLNDF